MYVEIIIAFLGAFVGNIIRQIMPFARKYWLGEVTDWDPIYTRRLIASIVFSFFTAYARAGEFIFGANTLIEIFAANIVLGLPLNWILEEMAKWEWSDSERATNNSE